MKVRWTAGRLFGLLAASATVVGVGGCVPRVDDINTVQPGYVRKAIFQTDHEWYYRRTIAKSEVTNGYVIEGLGDIDLERVKFEIQEELLIAYQPYENIPGADLDALEGDFYKGPVLAAWPITSHFDIIRSYDSLTGNETNRVEENTEDRPWYEREFMRVSWNDNLIEASFFADRGGWWFPVSMVSTGDYWVPLEAAPTDPYASRFAEDYVEVTNQAFVAMDVLMCWWMSGATFTRLVNLRACPFGEAKIRHSFTRIDRPSDFIPRDFPDSVVRKGPDGRPLYDPETGEVIREPYYNRFGIFRRETPTYDPGYGFTESGRLFRAQIYNLWERSVDDNGNIIPYPERAEKPIIFYLNSEYPERYRLAAFEVAEEYNRVFTSMVMSLKGVEGDVETCGQMGSVKCMFQIRVNSCNESAIQQFVARNPDLLYAVERAVCEEGAPCDLEASDLAGTIGVGNLETVCTSLEAATLDPSTGRSRFQWQRIGDPRYNMVVWLANPQDSPWIGYGPTHADALTGEAISSTSYIRGSALEVSAANVVDYLELINGEKTVDQIVYGQDVRSHVNQVLARGNLLARTEPSAAYLSRLDARIDALGSGREELLPEVPNPRHQLERLERIRGTGLEEKLITELDLVLASEGTWSPDSGQEPSDELKELASPVHRLTTLDPTSSVRLSLDNALTDAGYCFLHYDLDPHWAGLALSLEGAPREEKYRVVLDRLIKHIMLHELGHNVGLAHNFEGSYDAMNYADEFWRLEDASDEEKVAGQQDEYRHTSVMEYLSNKGIFADFLGKYDEAAIRFAYANQVQVFAGDNVDPNLAGGEALRSWRYLNDYRDIPDHLCGPGRCADASERMAVLRERRWVEFDPQNPPEKEVPYLFCDNYFNRLTPFCATFDYGSNLREIFANYYTMWSSYFFFNNFSRDRLVPLTWTPLQAFLPVSVSMSFLDTVAQYFYFLNATQGPEFRTTDLHEDMATTLAHGLNMAAEIISTPEPDRMCPWPNSNPSVYLSWAFFPEECDQYAPINSGYARSKQMIELPLGDARPATLAFTTDFEDYQLEYVGSYFDKDRVIYSLGRSNPRLFRFNYDIDRRNYFISLYRLFEPELRAFYDDLINLDGWFVRQQTAIDLGSFWCRDEINPAAADLGYFEPKRMIDPVTNTSLPGPSSTCRQPAYIYPRLLANMPYTAMYVAHALFSSDLDAQLDMGKDMKVYVLGSDDDFPSWRDFPSCEVAEPNEDCYCSMVDDLTNLEYRAVQFAGTRIPGEPVEESVGCRLIAFAEDAQSRYQNSLSPGDRDNWRQWIERLEFARDLYRVYHNR